MPSPHRIVIALACGLLAPALAPWPAAVAAAPADTAAGPAPASPPEFHAADAQLRRLIEAALAGNPRLAGERSRAAAADRRADGARALPDPALVYRHFLREPETRVGPQRQSIELMQALPWPGKRRLDESSAREAADGASWEAVDAARRVVADVKGLYYEAAYLQAALAANADERTLLERFEAAALRRYASGEGLQQSVIKVQAAVNRLNEHGTRLDDRLRRVRVRIAELLGASGDVPPLEPIRLAAVPRVDDADRLATEALAVNAGVLAASASVRASGSVAARRVLARRPDLRVGLGYTFVGEREDAAGLANPPEDNGRDVLALTVGINIPLRSSRIRAGIEEARALERRAEQLLAARRDRVRSDVHDGAFELSALAERVRILDDVILPQAEQALAAAEAAYATGSLGFLDLLDSQRVLFEVRLSLDRLRADAWIAAARLEYALGRPFPESEPAGVEIVSARAARGVTP